MMKKISAILFLTFLAGVNAQGAIFTPSGVELEFDRADAGYAQLSAYFCGMDRALTHFFHLKSLRRKAIACRIDVISKVHSEHLKTLSIDRDKDGIVVRFNDADARFFSNFALRNELCAVILLARTGREPSPEAIEKFPAWITAGLEHYLKSSSETGRKNRYFPCLRYCAAKKIYPDFEAMRKVRAELLDDAAFAWFAEFSRVILEAALATSQIGENVLTDYVISLACDGASEDEAFQTGPGRVLPRGSQLTGKNLRTREHVRSALEQFCRTLGWNGVHPRPAELTMQAFRNFRVLKLTDYDNRAARQDPVKYRKLQKRKEFHFADISKLPELLTERDDAWSLRAGKMRELSRIAAGTGRSTGRAFAELNEAMLKLPYRHKADLALNRKFQAALQNVENTLKRQIAAEKLLDQAEMTYPAFPESLRNALFAADEAPSPLGRAGEKFLLETEKSYLED